MEAPHRNILRRNRVSLVRELSVDEICQIMVGVNILSDHMVEEISSETSPFKRNVAFLTKLPTRGPLAFDTFCQALHDTDQDHLAELLSPTTHSTEIIEAMPHSANATPITPPSFFSFGQSTPSKTQIWDPHCDISTTNLSSKSFNISPTNKLYSPILMEKSPNVTSSTYKTTNKSDPSRLTPVEHVDVSVFEQQNSVMKFDAHMETLHSASSIEDLCTTASLTKYNHTSTADTNHICFHLSNNHISNTTHGDMQSMPLVTDAPTWENVAVRPTTLKFLQERIDDCYPMFNSCKGIALIISVTKFEQSACLDDRLGGDRDSARLELMFNQLSYEVFNLKNGTAHEIWNTLKNFSAWPKLGQCSSCFIVLMSHGEDGVIFGKDGQPVCLKDVFDLFSNENCSYLQNKPKVFLIQACRGCEPDQGTDQIDGPTPEKRPYLKEEGHGKNVKRRLLDENKNEMKVKLPTQSDCLIAYATVPGYTAMRNTEQGSWFIQAFIQIVAFHAKDKSLLEIMTMTNNQMKSREGWSPKTEFHRCKEMSEFTSCLCKPFYFFPGLYLKQTS